MSGMENCCAKGFSANEGCYRDIGLFHTPDFVYTVGLVHTTEPVHIRCLILVQWNNCKMDQMFNVTDVWINKAIQFLSLNNDIKNLKMNKDNFVTPL